MSRQKDIEREYLDQARKASPIFPAAEPFAYERPDFLFQGPSGILGVEITELCAEGERGEGARLDHVIPRAKHLYQKMAPRQPISVSPVLSLRLDNITVDVLAGGLANFVYAHRDRKGTYKWTDRADPLPIGWTQVGILDVLPHHPDGHWLNSRAIHTTRATREQFERCISEKERRLADYRQVASEVWLLIVNDLFLGPGEVSVLHTDLDGWFFDFTFDRVLLFERQPGGPGRIFDVRRNVPAPG